MPTITDDMVLIRMQRMGFCGTDVGYFKRGPVGRYGQVQPFILGHEGAGKVVEVGSNVKSLTVGTRVAIDPSQPCRQCHTCLSGRYNLCPEMRYLGSAATIPPGDGLFSEYLAFPAQNCYPLPDPVSDGEAAMIEPLSVALHAVQRAGKVALDSQIAGASVLVMGGGPIGQLTLLVAKALGATWIALSEIVESRRRFALAIGATLALNPLETTLATQVTDLTGDGFDFVFEAAGSFAALDHAIKFVRPGGTIVQIGGLPADLAAPINRIMPKEIQYLGSFRFVNVFQRAIDLVATKRIDIRPLISETLPFDAFDEAMQLATAKEGVVKVQLRT